MYRYLVVALLFILFISILALQNSQPVTIKFLYWSLPSFPLVLIILFSAATGALITLLFSVAGQVRLTIRARELQSRIRQLEKKLNQQPAAGESNRRAGPGAGPTAR